MITTPYFVVSLCSSEFTAADIIPTDREKPVAPARPDGVELDLLTFLKAPVESFTLQHAEKLLAQISPDVLYPEWLEVAMALRHQFTREFDAQRAYKLFDSWSSKGAKYGGPEETLEKWNSVKHTPLGREPITVRTLIARVGQTHALPPIKSAAELLENPPTRPPELIKGVLFKGGKFIMAAPSKARKTWTNIDLAVSVATGTPWLGYETDKSSVLYLDFELSKYDFWYRLKEIVSAKGVDIPTGLHLWGLRGQTLELARLLPEIRIFTKTHNVGLIVVDPLYAALRGRDENSNSEMADLMFELERIAQETGAAVSIVHHFAKGNASGKDAQDRMSGAGALARAADTMLVLTPHENDTDDDPTMVAEIITRSFRKPLPTVLKWRGALWVPEKSMDPGKLKSRGRGRKCEYREEDIIEALAGDPLSYGELLHKVQQHSSMSKSTFNTLLRNAVDHGPVSKTSDGRYESIL